MEVSEQQLMSIKGIGMGKARQLIAMLKLAKALTVPNEDQFNIRNPKDAFDLLEPDFRHSTKSIYLPFS
jgi:DNA repair protein RadC